MANIKVTREGVSGPYMEPTPIKWEKRATESATSDSLGMAVLIKNKVE